MCQKEKKRKMLTVDRFAALKFLLQRVEVDCGIFGPSRRSMHCDYSCHPSVRLAGTGA